MAFAAPLLGGIGAAGAATTVALGASAASAVIGGIGAQKQAKSVAGQQAAQARAAEIRGLEVEASLRDELNRTLSGFAAARGANGLSLDSPTGLAIAGDLRKYARQDYLTSRRNTAQQVAGIEAEAKSTLRQGRFSLVSGLFDAAIPLYSLGQRN